MSDCTFCKQLHTHTHTHTHSETLKQSHPLLPEADLQEGGVSAVLLVGAPEGVSEVVSGRVGRGLTAAVVVAESGGVIGLPSQWRLLCVAFQPSLQLKQVASQRPPLQQHNTKRGT